MTRVLHTAKISNVDSIMFINRIRKIVGFELVKEIEKDVFRLVTSVKQRKNSEFSFVLNRHMAAYCMKTLNLDLLLKRGCPMCRIFYSFVRLLSVCLIQELQFHSIILERCLIAHFCRWLIERVYS